MFNECSVREVCKYLGIKTELIVSSMKYNNSELSSDERIIDICKLEGAIEYVNPIGGISLYDKDVFKSRGLKLSFIHSNEINYYQFGKQFVPWLSIVDVLMFNSVEQISAFLDDYKLIY